MRRLEMREERFAAAGTRGGNTDCEKGQTEKIPVLLEKFIHTTELRTIDGEQRSVESPPGDWSYV